LATLDNGWIAGGGAQFEFWVASQFECGEENSQKQKRDDYRWSEL
jgi:hypothetical protein